MPDGEWFGGIVHRSLTRCTHDYVSLGSEIMAVVPSLRTACYSMLALTAYVVGCNGPQASTA